MQDRIPNFTEAWSSSRFLAKVLSISVPLLVIAVVATGATTYHVAKQRLQEELVASGAATAENLATASALELLDTETGPLNLKLRLQGLLKTGQGQRLVGAQVLDPRGTRLAHAGRAEALEPGHLPSLTDASVRVVQDATTLTVLSPIVYERVLLGHAVLSYDASIIRDAGNQILWRLVGLTLFFIFLNIVVLLLVLRTVMKPVVALGEAAEHFVAGDYRHRIPQPLPNDEIGAAAQSFNRMCDALEVHLRFSNDALAQRIHSGNVPNDASEHQLSILFGDAKGYTQWSQCHTPDQVFRTLNRYYTCFGAIAVRRFRGIVDKFMGDGVMAHYGLSKKHAPDGVLRNHVCDALRSVIYAQAALRILSYAISEVEGEAPLNYRFGIASGRCLVGAVGARDVMLDFSVIGNAVNLAARLESQAPAGGLVIDRFTLIDSGGDFVEACDRGERQIKGIEVPVRIFAVRGFANPDDKEAMRQYFRDEFFADPLMQWALAQQEHIHPELLARLREQAARVTEGDFALPTD